MEVKQEKDNVKDNLLNLAICAVQPVSERQGHAERRRGKRWRPLEHTRHKVLDQPVGCNVSLPRGSLHLTHTHTHSRDLQIALKLYQGRAVYVIE